MPFVKFIEYHGIHTAQFQGQIVAVVSAHLQLRTAAGYAGRVLPQNAPGSRQCRLPALPVPPPHVAPKAAPQSVAARAPPHHLQQHPAVLAARAWSCPLPAVLRPPGLDFFFFCFFLFMIRACLTRFDFSEYMKRHVLPESRPTGSEGLRSTNLHRNMAGRARQRRLCLTRAASRCSPARFARNDRDKVQEPAKRFGIFCHYSSATSCKSRPLGTHSRGRVSALFFSSIVRSLSRSSFPPAPRLRA